MHALFARLSCWCTNAGTVIPLPSSRLVHGWIFTSVMFVIILFLTNVRSPILFAQYICNIYICVLLEVAMHVPEITG